MAGEKIWRFDKFQQLSSLIPKSGFTVLLLVSIQYLTDEVNTIDETHQHFFLTVPNANIHDSHWCMCSFARRDA